MDKSNFNFSVHPSRQPEKYVGLCAEFSSLSYLADTTLEAYQGIVQLVCNFEEQIESNKNEAAYTKWFADYAQAIIDNTRPSVSHQHVLTEISALLAMRERFDSLRQAIREKRVLNATTEVK